MKVFFVFIFFLLSINANAAGNASSFEIDHVRVDRSGKGYVMFKQTLRGTPADCVQPGYVNALAFDTNTEGGKAIYSSMLAAFLAQKKVTARGTGTCLIYPNVVEGYEWGYVHS